MVAFLHRTLWANLRCARTVCHEVMPSDLDVLRHVNNGKFFSILDLGRVDLLIRSGISPKLIELGWYGVVVAETIQFRKSLKLFDGFDVESTIIDWNSKVMFVQQRFLRAGQTISSAVIQARFLAKSHSKVSPEQFLNLAGHSGRLRKCLSGCSVGLSNRRGWFENPSKERSIFSVTNRAGIIFRVYFQRPNDTECLRAAC
jgi:acyl-CoA thioesterase FadM